VPLGYNREAHASQAISDNGWTVDIQWRSTDSASFKFGPAHACANTLDDERPFQFGNG
jgi:hypothetical protein